MMDIKLYQVNMDRDENRVAFDSLERLERFQGTAVPKSEIYDRVFAGEVDTNSLEGVFAIFNMRHPAGYTGRSMSVSDIVEVVSSDSEDIKPGFYFCDSFGFKEVPFEPEKAVIPETMTVLYLAPGEKARVMEIDPSLRSMQRLVLGHIEGIYPFTEDVCIVCNDEAKINGMELNRAVYAENPEINMSYGELTKLFREKERDGSGKHVEGYIVFSQDSFTLPYSEESRTYVVSSDNKAFQANMSGYSIFGSCLDGTDPCVRLEAYMSNEKGGKDGWKIERCYMKEPGKEMIEIIAGPCFLCDCSGESYASLSDEQIQRYMKMFELPEQFFKMDGKFVAVPYDPDKKIDNIISQAKQKTEVESKPGKTPEQER